MFWSLAYASHSTVDAILTSADGFTLEQLLDEDELLQECKSQNQKLVEFLSQPETMKELVKYAIEMPSETDSESRQFKYPYVASEVLASDVPALRDVLFVLSHRLIEQLLSVLEQPPPIPPVLAGYNSKVIVALFKSAPEKFFLYFNELWALDSESPLSLSKLLPRLLLHLGSDAVLHMLTVLCVGEPAMAEPGVMQMQTTSSASWIPHSQLVSALFDSLDSDDAEAVQNSAALIVSLLDGTAGLPTCLCEPEEEAKQRCRQLVATCLGGKLTIGGSLNLPAVDVLLRVFSRCRELNLSSAARMCSSSLLDSIAEGIDCFFMGLATPAQLPQRIARFLPERDLDSLPRPQAPQRVKLLRLFEEALRFKNLPVMHALNQLGFYDVVLDLLLLPHTCNALHMVSAAIIEANFKMEGEESQLALSSLLNDANLLERLIGYCSEALQAPIRPSGYGFVASLTAVIRDRAHTDSRVAAAIAACDGWEALVSSDGALGQWDAMHSKPLGGRLPTRSSDMDDDSDNDGDMSASSRDIERALAAQAAALRERAEQSRDGDDDDDDEVDAGHSSNYLEHFAQYLSQRDFVNDMSNGLDAALSETPADESPSDSQWSAEFEDSGWHPEGADPASLSVPVTNVVTLAPATTASALLAFDDDDDDDEFGPLPHAVPPGAVPAEKNDRWCADFEQVATVDEVNESAADDGTGWAAAFLPPSTTDPVVTGPVSEVEPKLDPAPSVEETTMSV